MSNKLTNAQKELIGKLEGLVHKRVSIKGLEGTLSTFFNEKIHCVEITDEEDMMGNAADFQLSFSTNTSTRDIDGVFDIYFLRERIKRDPEQIYITEVSCSFGC